MKHTYTILNAYHPEANEKYGEIEIKSEGLIYIEIQDTHSGCQSNNLDNNEIIHRKCREISKLIKEIDKLNQVATNDPKH